MSIVKFTDQISINATPEQVWETVVNKEKFETWTRVFMPTSYFEGGWNKGDKVKFVGVDEKGDEGGMLGSIEEARFPEFISIVYHGFIVKGEEDTTSEAARSIAGTHENYTIAVQTDGTTTFLVELDTLEEYLPMFNEMWPKALLKLKEIAEQN